MMAEPPWFRVERSANGKALHWKGALTRGCITKETACVAIDHTTVTCSRCYDKWTTTLAALPYDRMPPWSLHDADVPAWFCDVSIFALLDHVERCDKRDILMLSDAVIRHRCSEAHPAVEDLWIVHCDTGNITIVRVSF